MQGTDSCRFSHNFDIVFIGASISNILSAKTLLDRFEGLKLRVLASSSSLQNVDDNLIKISAAARKGLVEICPELATILHHEGDRLDSSFHQHSEDNQIVFLEEKRLHEILISSLPRDIFIFDHCISNIHQTADFVELHFDDKQKCLTKLLIENTLQGLSEMEFVETSFSVSHDPLFQFTQSTIDHLYVCRHVLESGKDLYSCIGPVSISIDRVVSHELMETVDSSNVKTTRCPIGKKVCLATAQGRIAKSGEITQFIPSICTLKLESEIDQALLLRKAILLKGLTAAALSDWKRRKNDSPKTQYLLALSSPLELFSNPWKAIEINGRESSREEKRKMQADLGKPLVCSPEKRPMIWHLID